MTAFKLRVELLNEVGNGALKFTGDIGECLRCSYEDFFVPVLMQSRALFCDAEQMKRGKRVQHESELYREGIDVRGHRDSGFVGNM
jgi:hypothetical protein